MISGSMTYFHQYDIPCAFCLTRNMSLVQMFPGKIVVKKTKRFKGKGVKIVTWLSNYMHFSIRFISEVIPYFLFTVFYFYSINYPGWKFEYRGYIMAEYHDLKSWTQYICIDGQLDDSHPDRNGKLFYKTEIRYAPLKCPPYVEGR